MNEKFTFFIKFVVMRKIWFMPLIFLLACNPAKKTTGNNAENLQNQDVPVSQGIITIRQIDGTNLRIAGFGNMIISYTETEDGYTIVLNNDGIYEYAKQTKNGDLVASGVKAKNPEERTKKEKRYLKNKIKKLRYQNPKLNEILEKRKQLFDSEPRKYEKK